MSYNLHNTPKTVKKFIFITEIFTHKDCNNGNRLMYSMVKSEVVRKKSSFLVINPSLLF